MKIKFQIILKKAVHPEHYLLSKLFPLVQAESSSLGDYDLETVRSWISEDYYTYYDAVPNRKLLGFTIDIPVPEGLSDEVKENFITQIRRLIDTPVQSLNPDTSCFAIDLQNDIEIVEAILRYEDDFILEYYKIVQPQIFMIEMRLREVLNYILSYTLPRNNINSFLQEFEGWTIPNTDLKNNQHIRKERSEKYYENELFWLVFTSYGYIRSDKQKMPKPEDVFRTMQYTNSFDELKSFFFKITFSDLDNKYSEFVNKLFDWLKPIEKMRNEIMHTRKPSVENEVKYKQAKEELLDSIREFWNNERSKQPNIETIKAYLLDIIFDENVFEYYQVDETVKFKDLNFEEQEEMWVDEFKSHVFDQVSEILQSKYNYNFTEDTENLFYTDIDNRIYKTI